MKVLESAQSALRYYIPKDSIVSRLAPVALPLFALVGLLFLQYKYGLMSLAGRLFSGNNQTLPELFSQAVDEGIPSRPVLKTGAAYDSLIQRRAELSAIQKDQLFYAELLSVCNEDGKLIHPDKVLELARTFVTQPDNWSIQNQKLYRSILLEQLSYKYGINYDDNQKMASVIIKEQELKVEVIQDNGDCLFLSFIAGLSFGHDHTPESLRKLASEKLLEALQQDDSEGLLLQLAEGMRMHKEAHNTVPQESLILQTLEAFDFNTIKGQFQNNPALTACTNKEDFINEWRRQNPPEEDATPAPELAQHFCELLVQPRTIYPGEETIKILAELFRSTNSHRQRQFSSIFWT